MSQLRKNIIYNLVGQTFLLIVSFISVKYIYQRLGADSLGLVYFSIMFSAMLSAALGMGIGPMLVREIARHIDNDKEQVQKLIQTTSIFLWAIFLSFSLIVYLLAFTIVSKWINLESMGNDTALYTIRVLSIASLLSLPQLIYTGVLNGVQRMEYTNAIQVVVTLIQQTGIITIIAYDGRLLNVVYWVAGSNVLMTACYLTAAARFVPANSFLPKFHAEVFKKNLKFSLNLGIISIISFLNTQVDKIIISKFLPVGVVGYYSVAYSLVSKVSLFAGPVSNAAYPAFCELFESGSHNKLLVQYNKLQDMICYISIPILSFILFINQHVLTYLLDANVAKTLLVPIIFLCAAAFIQISFQAPYHFMLAAGEAATARRISSYSFLVSLPTAIVFIYYWGLAGAGAAFFLSRLFNLLYGIPIISKKCLKLSSTVWFLNLAKVFSLFLASYFFVWLLVNLMNIQSIYGVTISYLFASSLYLIGAWFLIGKDIKSSLLSGLSQLSHRQR